MKEIEQVLVIERRILEKVGYFQGVRFDVAPYLTQFWTGDGVSFMSRTTAEQNPAYKQLIPYVIMMHEDNYLCYMRGRATDESRLAEKVSIGIGGHINPSDATVTSSGSLQQVYLNAVAREVAEEVMINTPHDDRIVGLINDDSNDVGRVHMGIVHIWRLAKPEVTSREDEICRLQFMSERELLQVRPRMETWSQLCLDCLGTLVSVSDGWRS